MRGDQRPPVTGNCRRILTSKEDLSREIRQPISGGRRLQKEDKRMAENPSK